MKFRHFITAIVLAFFATNHLYAQDSTYSISTPVEIPKEGWNKVVQLRNGNTVLLHFENKKGIVVKVFDKDRKEIASKKHLCNVIDINGLDATFFHGLHDINGEATLFLTQDIDNAQTLVRLRIDGNSGALLAEDKIVKSPSFQRRTTAYLMKKPIGEGYAVFCYTTHPTDTATAVKLIRYNDKHEVIKEIPYDVPSKAYDNIGLLDASMDEEGDILISMQLSKIINYPDVMERTLALLYMPEGEDRFMFRKMKLPSSLELKDATFSINPFAGNINMLITKSWETTVQNGLNRDNIELLSRSMFIMPKDISGIRETRIAYEKPTQLLREAMKDTTINFYGSMIDANTDGRGVTTVVYEQRYLPYRPKGNEVVPYYTGNVCVVQYDDNGAEMWATVLPKEHYYVVRETFPSVFKRTSQLETYKTLYLCGKKSHYILFNDVEENCNKRLGEEIKKVYNYQNTNAMYYHMNKRNVVVQKYLLGAPVAGEFKYIYPGSADFDKQNNSVALLMCHKKEAGETFHIAWKKLEN